MIAIADECSRKNYISGLAIHTTMKSSDLSEATTCFITANGKEYTLPAGATIPDFLEQLQLAPRRVAIEYNRKALTPAELRQQTLSNGDILEIVKVVAGG